MTATVAAVDNAPRIERVAIEPKTLRWDAQQRAAIRYHLSAPARVTLDVLDAQGTVTRQLIAEQTTGMQEWVWDGRRSDGTPASDGAYRYVLRAEARGRQMTYDPAAYSGGDEIRPMDFTFDRARGLLQWRLPQAARVRLRIGIEGFPHLRTLLDWQPMEAGAHELLWNGLDASGLVRAISHPQLSVKLTAFTLPDNAIIVTGTPTSPMLDHADTPQIRRGAYLHARHDPASCGDVALQLEFPQHLHRDVQGRVRVAGQVPVRVTLPEARARDFTNQRFEAVVFEDLTVLFEEEEALNPFTFVWDVSRLPAGAHLLTVNVLSYDDHYGVATVPVIVEPSPSAGQPR